MSNLLSTCPSRKDIQENSLSPLTAEGEAFGSKIFGLSQRLSPKCFTPATSSPLPTGMVFIDSNIDDYETLKAGVKPGLEVVLLDSSRDGIVQISEVLERHRGLLSLHIVAHGEMGGLWLGSGLVNSKNLHQYRQDFQSWGNALAPDGDILLYGCHVGAGETGREFVRRLSELTGADVAASRNLTGSAALGGDWDLEVQVGDVDAPLAFRVEVMESYGGVLMPIIPRPTITFGSATYTAIEGSTANWLDIPVTVTGFHLRRYRVPIEVNYSNSTATQGQDYAIETPNLEFPIPVPDDIFHPFRTERTQYVRIRIEPDNIPEGNEKIVIRLGDVRGGSPDYSTREATIIIPGNDRIYYGVTAGTPTVTEGNSGSTTITFTVNRSGDINTRSSVNYSIGGSATFNSDYNSIGGTSGATTTTGTINFAPGQTSRTITMNVLGDTIVEPHETIAVTLSPAASGPIPTITTPVATTTIRNDDIETPRDTLALALNSGLSSANPGTFNLNAQIGDNSDVSRLSDVDMIAFQLNAGGRIAIDIDANQNGSPLDSVLRIFDANGNEVAFSDDNAAPGETASLDPYLNFTATQTGTYYVGVSGYCNDDYNPSIAGSGIGNSAGNYSLQMTVLPSPLETPGDTIATALNSGFSSANPSTFNLDARIGDNPSVASNSDVDMIAFQLDQGSRVAIDINTLYHGHNPTSSTPPDNLDSVLRIFDSNGNQLAVNDDENFPTNFDSYLDLTAPQTGTYYVGVSNYYNFNYNPNVAGIGSGATTNIGNYNLQIRMLETPGDTITTARQSGLSSSNTGTFVLNAQIGDNPNLATASDDVDMIAFAVNQGGQVVVNIDAFLNGSNEINGSSLVSYLRIFNSNGTQVASNSFGASPGENPSLDSYLRFTAPQAGTYYLGVSSFNNSNYNPFVEGSATPANLSFTTGNYNLQLSVVSNGSNVISGTAISETLFGTAQSDVIYGLAGNDTIYANDGNNAVYGGAGNDTIYAGNGNDFIDGGADNDIIYANEGNNTIYGGAGNDSLYAGNGNDVIDGGAGNDTIYANGGNNTINGGAGIDTLFGGNGNDIIDGGADNDTIYANDGNNTINGGTGNDSLYGGNGNDLINGDDGNDTIYANEGNNTINGGAGIDILYAGNGNDVIDGGADNDTIYANGGNNTINGGAGIDILYAGNGNDIMDGGADNDTIYANEGNNIINGGTGIDTIYSGSGKDIINGGDGNDTIYSNAGNDSITGGVGNDTIYAGAGDDLINGGIGDDTLWLGGGQDLVILESGDGFDTINGFQLGQTTFHLGSGLTTNNLTISNSANGAEIYAGSDRLAVVSWTQASVIQNNLSTIFV